jgi:hypothetical protein
LYFDVKNPETANPTERRFDAVIKLPHTVYVDFACSSNHMGVRMEERKKRACIPRYYERHKRSTYEQDYTFPPDRLLIAACDPYGSWGDEMERFFKGDLRLRIADLAERGRQVRYAREALSRACLMAFHKAVDRLRMPKITNHYKNKHHEQQHRAGEPQHHQAQVQVQAPQLLLQPAPLGQPA